MEDVGTLPDSGEARPLQKCSKGPWHDWFIRSALQAVVLPQGHAGKVQHQHHHVAGLMGLGRRVEEDA